VGECLLSAGKRSAGVRHKIESEGEFFYIGRGRKVEGFEEAAPNLEDIDFGEIDSGFTRPGVVLCDEISKMNAKGKMRQLA
jgi:hypothetical protein